MILRQRRALIHNQLDVTKITLVNPDNASVLSGKASSPHEVQFKQTLVVLAVAIIMTPIIVYIIFFTPIVFHPTTSGKLTIMLISVIVMIGIGTFLAVVRYDNFRRFAKASLLEGVITDSKLQARQTSRQGRYETLWVKYSFTSPTGSALTGQMTYSGSGYKFSAVKRGTVVAISYASDKEHIVL